MQPEDQSGEELPPYLDQVENRGHNPRLDPEDFTLQSPISDLTPEQSQFLSRPQYRPARPIEEVPEAEQFLGGDIGPGVLPPGLTALPMYRRQEVPRPQNDIELTFQARAGFDPLSGPQYKEPEDEELKQALQRSMEEGLSSSGVQPGYASTTHQYTAADFGDDFPFAIASIQSQRDMGSDRLRSPNQTFPASEGELQAQPQSFYSVDLVDEEAKERSLLGGADLDEDQWLAQAIKRFKVEHTSQGIQPGYKSETGIQYTPGDFSGPGFFDEPPSAQSTDTTIPISAPTAVTPEIEPQPQRFYPADLVDEEAKERSLLGGADLDEDQWLAQAIKRSKEEHTSQGIQPGYKSETGIQYTPGDFSGPGFFDEPPSAQSTDTTIPISRNSEDKPQSDDQVRSDIARTQARTTRLSNAQTSEYFTKNINYYEEYGNDPQYQGTLDRQILLQLDQAQNQSSEVLLKEQFQEQQASSQSTKLRSETAARANSANYYEDYGNDPQYQDTFQRGPESSGHAPRTTETEMETEELTQPGEHLVRNSQTQAPDQAPLSRWKPPPRPSSVNLSGVSRQLPGGSRSQRSHE